LFNNNSQPRWEATAVRPRNEVKAELKGFD